MMFSSPMKVLFLSLATLLTCSLSAEDVLDQSVSKADSKFKFKQTKAPPPCESPQDNTFTTQLDFLYWKASNIGFVPANLTLTRAQIITSSTGIKADRLRERWKPGFRVGLGWNFDFDRWNLQTSWTYYYNKSYINRQIDLALTSGANNNEGFFGYWIPYVSSTGNIQRYLDYQSRWRFNHNTVDLQLGKSYSLMSGFLFHPTFGLKTAWLQQHFSSQFLNNDASFTPILEPSQFDRYMDGSNNYWGIGPGIGVDSDWQLISGFSLFGNLSGALLWGITDVRSTTGQITEGNERIAVTKITDSFYQLAPTAKMALGLAWSSCFNRDRTFVHFSLSWETNFWWNQFHLLGFPLVETAVNDRPNFNIDNPAYLNQPLIMEGVTANLKFDF